MLTYEPGTSLAHRLDPRSKLLVQFGFAIAVFTHPTPVALVVLTGFALAVLAVVRLSPLTILRTSWFILVLLVFGALLASLVPREPWVVPSKAIDSLLAGYRVIPVLFVAGAYVRSTPVRDTRAAIQRHVPGRPGQLFGVGIALVFRFFPVLLGDIREVRNAIKARGGDERSAIDRTRRTVLVGIRRAFERAHRLSVALRARCFAWNPTLPALSFTWVDYPVLLLGVGLALTPLLF